MGHLHPPNENSDVLDIIKFLPFIKKSLILAEFLGKNTKLHPQTTFLATPLSTLN